MTQKKKTGISRLLEFGGRYRWMTVVACILSGLSSVLMLCPFLCIWLVLRDVLAALPDWLGVYLLIVNVAAFAVYGADKRRAKQGRWRVPEKTLFLLAIIGGSVGALLGMWCFHHKTRHWYFRYGIPVILVVQLALAGWLWLR